MLWPSESLWVCMNSVSAKTKFTNNAINTDATILGIGVYYSGKVILKYSDGVWASFI